jgi:hypothetical protein
LHLTNQNHLCLHQVTLRVTHSRAEGPCIAGGLFLEALPTHVLHALLS